MSGKYAFAKSLKEVRFLFCQTSEQSAAARYANLRPLLAEVNESIFRNANEPLMDQQLWRVDQLSLGSKQPQENEG